MAINTSAMSEQIALISDEIVTEAIGNATTATMLAQSGNVQSGIKTSGKVLKMSADVVLQDGDTCSRNPLDSTIFGEITITVAPIKSNDNICVKNFYSTYLQAKVAIGQKPEDETISADLVKKIIEKKVEKIADKNEKLLWSGDVTLAAANPLHFFDGIRKQVKTGGGIALTGATGTTTLAKLQSGFLKTNIDVRHDNDFFLFIGEDTYDEYLMDLSTKNVYKPTEDGKLYGSSARFKVVPGLNGSKEAYFGKLEHLQMATDGQDDSEDASLVWSVETKSWYLDFAYSLGIKVIYPEQFTYLTGL